MLQVKNKKNNNILNTKSFMILMFFYRINCIRNITAKFKEQNKIQWNHSNNKVQYNKIFKFINFFLVICIMYSMKCLN